MILAYLLYADDDDSFMLGEDTFHPPKGAGFYDWRFGKDGVPHPATCPTCGRKTDPNYINPTFRVLKRRRDITATIDGYDLVSRRFRDYCRAKRWSGMRFLKLPADDDFFVLRLTKVLSFDSERRKTRFEKQCPSCRAFFNVVGASPAYLRGVTKPIASGFFRSDLEFASGHEQHPLILVGCETARMLKEQNFTKFDLEAVES